MLSLIHLRLSLGLNLFLGLAVVEQSNVLHQTRVFTVDAFTRDAQQPAQIVR
jgi:hypothetical protein